MIEIPSITAKNLAEIIKGELYFECSKIDSISIDTRENFNKNTCFIAIRGQNFNGNEFIMEAIDNKNCSLIITDTKLKVSFPFILVENTKKAFGLIAKHFSKGKKIIGITGSVGKTTVKEMTSLILKEAYKVYNTPKNENNEIGVSKALLSMKNCDYGVVEMGMRGLGEIEWLSYIAEPEISVVTNVGTAHLERLGSKGNIFNAKTEIFKHTKKYAIVPSEKRFLNYNFGNITPIYVGGEEINYCNLKYTKNGMSFCAKYKDKLIENIALKSFNTNNLMNALFAIAIGMLCGVDENDIKNGLSKYDSFDKHEEILIINGITIINDCYNASYESVRGALFSLKRYSEINNLNPYLLLGDMLEIGERSGEYHYRIGELAKDLEIKNLYAIGKYAKKLTDGFCGGVICDDKSEIAQLLMSTIGKGDVVLIKASRAMELERIIEEMKEMKNE